MEKGMNGGEGEVRLIGAGKGRQGGLILPSYL